MHNLVSHFEQHASTVKRIEDLILAGIKYDFRVCTKVDHFQTARVVPKVFTAPGSPRGFAAALDKLRSLYR